MGSPLSLIIADLYMEHFEQEAIRISEYKPNLWLRYVDDTFSIWKHGRARLQDFLTHLNSRRESIKFTMEIESENSLPFLDVKVTRDRNQVHTSVYRKPTHTDRYLKVEVTVCIIVLWFKSSSTNQVRHYQMSCTQGKISLQQRHNPYGIRSSARSF